MKADLGALTENGPCLDGGLRGEGPAEDTGSGPPVRRAGHEG